MATTAVARYTPQLPATSLNLAQEAAEGFRRASKAASTRECYGCGLDPFQPLVRRSRPRSAAGESRDRLRLCQPPRNR
jgi:hypothetical protein